MNWEGPQLLGLVAMALIALVVMAIGLRRQPRQIWLFALALLIVGLGYMSTTNAPTELARTIFGEPA
ncbi:MAG: hypothetical protein ACR2PG_24060 [Hyphomicrobiaceae bacterium]